MRSKSSKACQKNRDQQHGRCDECTSDCPLFKSHEMDEVILGVDLEKLVEELEIQEKIKKYVMFMR